MTNDTTLIDRCLRGEAHAWHALVERYERLVFSIPLRYGLAAADAEDVMQATFVSLYRSLAKLRDHQRLAPWLITTAHRETWRVGKARGQYAALDERIHDVSEPQEEHAVRWERQHLVRQALGQLGGVCEALLTALFLSPQAPSYDELAKSLGMRVGSIGPTRARCFQKLEGLLRQLGLNRDELDA